mgnify:CR=1 FL=1
MVVMLLVMGSGLIKVSAVGALPSPWMACRRRVELESVKERKVGVGVWV